MAQARTLGEGIVFIAVIIFFLIISLIIGIAFGIDWIFPGALDALDSFMGIN